VTSTRVALEKNRVGLRMISGSTETPSDWMTTSIPVSALAEFRASLEAESRKAAYAQGKQARTAE
jgi:hypothetical protein